MANYVPTTSAINLKKHNKTDTFLVERMVYINKILFAPLTLKYYLKFIPIDEGYTQLRPYLKEYHPNLSSHAGVICRTAKTVLTCLHKQINVKSSRKAFLFKIDELESFLLKCTPLINDNKNISQNILKQGFNLVSGCGAQSVKKSVEASVSNQSL